MKVFKILGSGCKKCQQTADIIKSVAEELKVEIKMEKVTDPIEFMQYGVMSTPGVVVDEVVLHAGSVPTKEQVKAMLL
jgi:small redox-active disulfide protein 2